MCAVIINFCRPYSIVQPAIIVCFLLFLSHAPDKPQRYDKYLTNPVFSIVP